MSLTAEQWQLYLDLGPSEYDPSAEQTIEQWAWCAAQSFRFVCRLELGGKPPSVEDCERAVRSELGGRLRFDHERNDPGQAGAA